MALLMQQQMLMSQMGSMFQQKNNTVQVKVTEADLQAWQLQKMQQQFAYMKAMQEHMTNTQMRHVTENKDDKVEVYSDVEDQPGDNIDRQLVDVAKHESRQKEVDKIMNESLASFLSDE